MRDLRSCDVQKRYENAVEVMRWLINNPGTIIASHKNGVTTINYWSGSFTYTAQGVDFEHAMLKIILAHMYHSATVPNNVDPYSFVREGEDAGLVTHHLNRDFIDDWHQGEVR